MEDQPIAPSEPTTERDIADEIVEDEDSEERLAFFIRGLIELDRIQF